VGRGIGNGEAFHCLFSKDRLHVDRGSVARGGVGVKSRGKEGNRRGRRVFTFHLIGRRGGYEEYLISGGVINTGPPGSRGGKSI